MLDNLHKFAFRNFFKFKNSLKYLEKKFAQLIYMKFAFRKLKQNSVKMESGQQQQQQQHGGTGSVRATIFFFFFFTFHWVVGMIKR